MKKEKEEKEEIEEIEECVGCHKKTQYLRSTPIKERECYVEGVGQACIDCLSDETYD